MILSFNYNGCRIQLFKNIFRYARFRGSDAFSRKKTGTRFIILPGEKVYSKQKKDRYDIKKDSLYVTGSNVLHKQLSSKDAPVFEISVYLKILGNTDDAAIRFFASKFFWIGKCSPQLRRIFNQLVSENSKTGLWRESILSALTLQMITEMTRLYYPDNASSLLPPEDCDLNENRSWILDTLFAGGLQ